MFLVSNISMLQAAYENGFIGCIPSLNWRTPEEFEEGLKELHQKCQGKFGVNIIVNKSNIHQEAHLKI